MVIVYLLDKLADPEPKVVIGPQPRLAFPFSVRVRPIDCCHQVHRAMECSKSPAEQVIAAFRERDIPFRKEIIESAFANEPDGPANSTWVSNHLRSDTLLSKEEINLYTGQILTTNV